ncbi:hypothetical protein NOJ05_18095 [Neorhizobium galegae]|uniref:hypothetical protein n=1 Tax=Neorhizobium galegae TaxID=399 RepID=UPI002103B520|nr:hypothetical protein [Neorhizobium galegae]MCQ1779119.1 hypothetical protein [Neorhizobium galegae]MCQ1799206.1 hypothetical protein [Neorhizobium galegae]
MDKQRYYYVDAPIGSGKTHALVNYLKTTQHPVTIGTKTNALTTQYDVALAVENLPAEAIFRPDAAIKEEPQESSSKRYKDGCRADFPFLIVTQNVAASCKQDTQTRDLFNDEIPTVYERIKIDGLPILQRIVASYFVPLDEGDSEFVRLRRTKKIAEAAKDGWKDGLLKNADESIRTALDRLSDSDFDVYVNRQDLNHFQLELRGWIALHVIMKPSRYAHYRSVSFIGANFKDSLLYLLWRDQVDFVPHPEIKADYHDIRDKAYQVELFAFSARDLSSARLNEVGRQTYYDACRASVAPIIGDQAHIYCMNNEKRGEQHLWSLPHSERLSPDPSGMNAYKSINVAVHMAALNENPDTYGFFSRFFGIPQSQVKIATTYERIYQFIGRTSIRVKEAKDRILIFVGDLGSALFLQQKISCSEPTMLNIDLETVTAPPKKRGRKSLDRTPDQVAEYERLRKRAQRLAKRNAGTIAPIFEHRT